MTARVAAGVSGALLLVAAVLAWWVHPALTAILVGVAVVVMTGWQLYRRSAGIPPQPDGVWTTFVVPLTFGALAVIALNGWIYRISADAGGESGEVQMLIGLITGVVGMAAAYGYGRVRAQRAQLRETAPAADAGDDYEESDDQEWFFPRG